MLGALREDLQRVWEEDCYGGALQRALQLATHQGAVAMAVYRLGRAARESRLPVVTGLSRVGYFVANKAVQVLTGINIHAEAELGPGTFIHGFGDIHIVGRTGRGCVFVQGAQMISAADGQGRGWPELGDNVYVGAGAKIVGPVTIGSNVVIGVNSVVTRSLPDNVTVAAMPARIVKQPTTEATSEEAAPAHNRGSAGTQ